MTIQIKAPEHYFHLTFIGNVHVYKALMSYYSNEIAIILKVNSAISLMFLLQVTKCQGIKRHLSPGLNASIVELVLHV